MKATLREHFRCIAAVMSSRAVSSRTQSFCMSIFATGSPIRLISIPTRHRRISTFADQRPDLEQSAFVEDLLGLGNWTIRAGLRWDHYQLLVNQNAFSPRLSSGRYVPSLRMMLHASYDRIFQTPSFENILISSSPHRLTRLAINSCACRSRPPEETTTTGIRRRAL